MERACEEGRIERENTGEETKKRKRNNFIKKIDYKHICNLIHLFQLVYKVKMISKYLNMNIRWNKCYLDRLEYLKLCKIFVENWNILSRKYHPFQFFYKVKYVFILDICTYFFNLISKAIKVLIKNKKKKKKKREKKRVCSSTQTHIIMYVILFVSY